MQVVTISSPRRPARPWRLMDYAGEPIEESQVGFPSISTVLGGRKGAAAALVIAATTSPPIPGERGASTFSSLALLERALGGRQRR